jgi:hypothetical protein
MHGPYWQFVTPHGATERYCRGCVAHVTPLPDGWTRKPDVCPDAPPAHSVAPAGWRVL